MPLRPTVPGMRRTLAGKVVVLTGGARGIGLATATALASQGCRVAVGDLDEGLLSKTAPTAGAEFWGYLDVTDEAGFNDFVDRVESALGPVDVLINNAGIMPTGHLVDEPAEVTRRMFDINIVAVVTGTKRALRTMLPRRSGHIINVASMAGVIYMAGVATYTASKWAVVGFTESARFEYSGSGVDFTTVLPGVVNTELTLGTSESRALRTVEPEAIADAIVRALQRPRSRAYVPKVGAVMARSFAITPRSLADRMLAATGGRDKFLDGLDVSAREGYETRARKS